MKRLLLLLTILITISSTLLAQSGGAGTAASIYRTTFAALGSRANGSVRYCTDCNANTSPCTGGGTGAFADRVNGAWVCETSSAITPSTPGGSTTQVQYNNAGAFGGITNVTTNGTNFTGLGTLPAFTLGGIVSGGGNQINNVIIGTTTPLAGAFTTGTFTGDVTHNGAAIILSGNISGSAIFGTGGIRLKGVAATFNDTTSSGTVAAAYTDTLGGNTLTATGATTITDYNTLNILPPTASTNITLTRKHSLGILDSTSAASSITGGLVVAAAYGTTATSVGIGGGNVNAGGTVTGAVFNSGASGFVTTSNGATTYGAAGGTRMDVNNGGSTIAFTAASGATFSGNLQAVSYSTATNCSDSAGAAACGSAAGGAFVIDATTTSTVVSTTAVTANSQIFLQEDSSLGTRLGITCNTQSILILGAPVITARTAGTSFTATIVVGPTTTPMCINYKIVN